MIRGSKFAIVLADANAPLDAMAILADIFWANRIATLLSVELTTIHPFFYFSAVWGLTFAWFTEFYARRRHIAAQPTTANSIGGNVAEVISNLRSWSISRKFRCTHATQAATS